MCKFILALLVTTLFTAVAYPDTPATTPATQPAPHESDPVRVNGLDFQLTAPAVWLTPSDEKGTIIPIALKVTNPGDKAIQLETDGAFSFTLKDSDGKELPMAEGADGVSKKQSPAAIANGKSFTIDRPAQLRNANDKAGTFWLAGSVGMSFWRFDGLKPGPYTLSMTYVSTPPLDVPSWSGKVTTKDLTVQVATPTAVSTKPIEKDGLSMTVTIPKATFAADEQPNFTVQFKNVSDKPFLLYDVGWNLWTIRFEDLTRKGPWKVDLTIRIKRAPDTHLLKPGETLDVLANFGSEVRPCEYIWEGTQSHPLPPLERLKPGKYQLTVVYDQKISPGSENGVLYWASAIITPPLDLEISDKPATQPAK